MGLWKVSISKIKRYKSLKFDKDTALKLTKNSSKSVWRYDYMQYF